MASYSVWLTEEENGELQKRLHDGETANQFLKVLVQKNLSANFLSIDCPDTEIAKIRERAQGESPDIYLTRLVQRDLNSEDLLPGDQTQNLQSGGDEANTKINFQSLLGEELFAKVQAEAGEDFVEYLKKSLLLQTDKNTISLTCPDTEIVKIDAGRNDKSRAEYLRSLLATDQNKEVAPSGSERIEGQIVESQKTIRPFLVSTTIPF